MCQGCWKLEWKWKIRRWALTSLERLKESRLKAEGPDNQQLPRPTDHSHTRGLFTLTFTCSSDAFHVQFPCLINVIQRDLNVLWSHSILLLILWSWKWMIILFFYCCLFFMLFLQRSGCHPYGYAESSAGGPGFGYSGGESGERCSETGGPDQCQTSHCQKNRHGPGKSWSVLC